MRVLKHTIYFGFLYVKDLPRLVSVTHYALLGDISNNYVL